MPISGHVPLHGFTIDDYPLSSQRGGDPSRAIKRMGGVERVDMVFEGHLLQGGLRWLVVEAGAGQAEQIRLASHRQLRVLPLYQGQPCGAGQAPGRFFPSQVSSVVNRPISA